MRLLTTLIPLLGAALCAQQPNVSNARTSTRSAGAGLNATLQDLARSTAGPFWVGYSVPTAPREGQSCCWSDRAYGCGLEGGMRTAPVAGTQTPVPLEGNRALFVLLRVENQQVGKIRTFSPDCPLDGGGLPFVWLPDVRPADSVSFLLAQAQRPREAGDKGTGKNAAHAIAQHLDPSVDGALDQLLASTQPVEVRKDVVFWLGAARGKPGVERLRRVLQEDPSDTVRKQVTFAFNVSKEPEALQRLIEAAKTDRSTEVRAQALFWLGQKAGKAAMGTLSDAVRDDPNTEVKKKAVFALSQLPNGEGVPLLIDVARKNADAAVRKQAMFWLGQSKDPRALQFFEDVLTK